MKKNMLLGFFVLFFSLINSLAFAATPVIVSISPSSGTSQPDQIVVFTVSSSDANGYQHINNAYFLINTQVNGANCFYGWYSAAQNKLYLRKDNNSGWLGGFVPGSNNIIENFYVKLNCASSSVSGIGKTATMKLSVTFKPTFVGAKKLYLSASDKTGRSSGWVQKGTWTIQGGDTTSPIGTIKINNDAAYTNSSLVALNLSATDSGSGMGTGAQMRFSNDNVDWSAPPIDYALTANWTLASGDGEKTVYVKFKDVAGNWSGAMPPDKINLDTAAPVTTATGIDDLWHKDPVIVTLSVQDSGSGVDKTYYSLDGSNPTLIYTGPIIISNSGIYTLKFYSKDKINNPEAVKTPSGQIKIEKDPPLGTIKINNDANSTNSTSVTLNLSATDANSGMGIGAQMQFSNDNSTWSAPEAYAITKSWTLTSGDGTKTVYAKFKDVAGNWSGAVSDTITLSASGPTGTIKINNDAQYTNSTAVTLALSAQTSQSGVTISQMQFSNDNTNWSTAENYAVSKNWPLTSGDNTKTVYAKFKDSNGVWSNPVSDTIILDATLPQVTLTLPSSGATLAGVVNITTTATDSSGITKVEFYVDASLVSSDIASPYAYIWDTTGFSNGPHTLKAIAYDNASNTNNQQISVTVNNQSSGQKLPFEWAYATSSTGSNDIFKAIDNNSATYWQGDSSAGYWWTSYNLESSQPLSKISIFWDKTYGSTSYNLYCSNDEQNWIPFGGFSSVGGTNNPNRKDHVVSGSFRYIGIEIVTAQNSYPIIYEVEAYGGQGDTTVPTGTIKINNDAQYTNTANVVLNLSATDSGSGMGTGAQMRFSNDNVDWSAPPIDYALTANWTLASGDGEKTVYVKFKDVAGNWSGAMPPDKINLDTAAPVTTATGIDDLWHKDPVIVTLSVQDSGSGVDKTYYSLDGSNPTLIYTGPIIISNSGIYTLKFYSKDKINNPEAVKTPSGQIKIEKDPPLGTIKINNDANSTNSTSVTLNLSATDANSGMGIGAQMQFSNDNSTWSAPEAYAITKSWTLTSGDGTKTVYAKFKDVAGNWSGAVSDTITLNTTVAPQIIQINPLDSSTFYEADAISIYPIVNSPSPAVLEYQFSIDGAIKQLWSAQTNYDWNASLGIHNLKAEVRNSGGQDAKQAEICVFRKPIVLPN